MRIAVVLVVLLTTLAHADAPRDAIERARELEAQLAYDEALEIIESAIQSGQSDRDRLVELHFIAGRLSGGLDRAKAAEDHFAVVLALDPTRTVPDGTSPKVTVPFTVARTKTEPLVIRLVATTAELTIEADPLVARISVSHGDGTFETMIGKTAPRKGVIAVRALDRYGNVLWTGAPPVDELPQKPPRVDDRSLFQRWTTWAALTGVALVAGGVSAWRYDRAQAEFDDKRTDGMTSFTDLQAIENRGKRWALAANISFGVAAALAITSVTTFIVFKPTDTADGGTVGVAGRF